MIEEKEKQKNNNRLRNKRRLVALVIIASIALSIFVVGISRPGCVSGKFKGFETEDWGDLCGQYPFTIIYLENASVWGIDGPDTYHGRIFFYGYHPELSQLTPGEDYSFFYHVSSRSADSDASVKIEEFNLDFYISLKSENVTAYNGPLVEHY